MIIALLGAESTGKSLLAQALARRLAQGGLDAAVVDEYLREFCERLQRTPRPEEQAGIAAEQTRRVAQAAADHAIVLADTTSLMVAVYSDYLFDDRSLYPEALAALRPCDLILVTGLDMPWEADGHIRDGAHVREPVDALLREQLRKAGLGYGVVYGLGEARLESAWRAIAPLLVKRGLVSLEGGEAEGRPDDAQGAATRMRPWCRECLVPECEHRLFKGLRAD